MKIELYRDGELVICDFNPSDDFILLNMFNCDLDTQGSALIFENRSGVLHAIKSTSKSELNNQFSNSLISLEEMLEIVKLIQNNHKLDAVKRIKDITNLGLKESRQFTDELTLYI